MGVFMDFSIASRQNSYDSYFRQRAAAADTRSNSGVPKLDEYNDPEIRGMKRAGLVECQTCKNRRYTDGSNDSGVSFKTPGYISPQASASVVKAHEQEHVRNESARAAGEGRKVVSQSVKLETSVCPECGRVYVSGGKTTTVTKGDDGKKSDAFTDSYNKLVSGFFGKKIDTRV